MEEIKNGPGELRYIRKPNNEEEEFLSLMKMRAIFDDFGIPVFGYAIMSAKFISAPGFGTMACDKSWRIYIDFDYWMSDKESVETSTNALLHEISHLLRNHNDRFDSLPNGKAQQANVATDAEINDDLFIDLGLKQPSFDIILPEKIGMKNDLTAEEYYNGLEKSSQSDEVKDGDNGDNGENGSDSKEGAGSGDTDEVSNKSTCGGGSGSGNKAITGEEGADAITAGVEAVQRDVIQRRVAQDIIEASKSRKGRGSVSDSMVRWAQERLAPKQVSWKTLLRSRVNGVISQSSLKDIINWKRPSRRQAISGDIYLPSRHGIKANVAWISDTSGSMGTAEGRVVVAEIDSILSNGRINLTAISSDSEVATVQHNVRQISQVKFIGGGGTDMRVPLQEAKRLHKKQRYNLAIVATDGETPWPLEEETFPFKVVALIIRPKGSRNGHILSHIPSYIETIVVDSVD